MPDNAPLLLPQHAALLTASAIAPQVIAARGYRSEAESKSLLALAFTESQCKPGLLMPVWNIRGQIAFQQLRPDEPRVLRGKVVKYEVPPSVPTVLDVPPQVTHLVLDVGRPLFITVGVPKADAGASKGLGTIGLLGVNGWTIRNADGQTQPLEDWQSVPVNGRPVYLILDSAARNNRAALVSWSELRDFLEGRGAHVQFILLPKGAGGAKVAFDDFIAAGHSVDDLLRRASSDLPVAPPVIATERYRATPDGIFRELYSKDGLILHQLASFHAIIKRQFIFTDGVDQERLYEIESEVRASANRFILPADEFEDLAWVYTNVGAEAIVSAEFGDKQHARAAIQQISGTIPCNIIYGHLGWVKHDGAWHYVNAGVVIGPDLDEPPAGAAVSVIPPENDSGDGKMAAFPADGADPGAETVHVSAVAAIPNLHSCEQLEHFGTKGPILAQQAGMTQIFTQLPRALSYYCLPEPPSGDALVSAIKVSLRFLGVGPDRIVMPIYAAIWRSVEETADYGLHVNGKSGLGKSELAALALQHLGAGFNGRNLPGSWSSTANALEATAFLVKDALFVVDDFVPRGSQSDVNRAHRDADRLLRAQGNHSGRARCQRNGTPMEGKAPRGLILSTGELSLDGFSLNSRLLDVQLRENDLDWNKMSDCQADAQRGVYAQAMAGFLRWFASRRDRLLAEKREQVESLRETFRQHCSHLRTATIAADLLAGWEIFLEFALEHGAIDEEEFDDLWTRYHEAMELILKEQESDQQTQDLADSFLTLLGAALLSGRAHVAALDGGPPDWYLDPTPGSLPAWGWEEQTFFVPKTPPPVDANQPPSVSVASRDDEEERTKRYSKGQRVGWITQEDLYLEPAAALAIVQRLAKECGQFLALTPRSLGKCLFSKGLLVRRDAHRNRYTVRKNIQGRRGNFLYLKASSVLSKEWIPSDLLEPGHGGPTDELLA